MNIKHIQPGFRQVARQDTVFQERVDDVYKIKGKLPEPTVCPQCRAVFHKGRWQWIEVPASANPHTCPACQRIHDAYPAGYITLKGDFFKAHHNEILQLVQNFEKTKKSQHPLQRIIAMEEQEGELLITTTDIHLARGLGEAVHNACQGNLELQYNQDENLLRVYWSR
ncbi:MAG: ATPase [Nitrosomonas sp.]|nr:BCAM0308 family protein [Nitrosomonas sp.]MCC6916786.1 ATPase [Nitrosomonas sp.]